jgi:hypothetical protein
VGGNLSATLDALTLAGTSQVLPLRYGVPLFEFSTQPYARSFVTPEWGTPVSLPAGMPAGYGDGFHGSGWLLLETGPGFLILEAGGLIVLEAGLVPPRGYSTPAWERSGTSRPWSRAGITPPWVRRFPEEA